MKSILKRFVLTLVLCVAAQSSFAYYYVTTSLQKIENGPDDKPCATIYVALWKHYVTQTGQPYTIFCASATYKVGDHSGKIVPRSDCSEPISLDSGLIVTEAGSPMCVSDMLSIPRVSEMIVASIDNIMAGVALHQTGISNNSVKLKTSEVRVYPNPASAYIMIDMALPDLNNAMLGIYDATGKEARQQNISGHRTQARITMDISSLPRGTYTALLKGIDGNATTTTFVLQ